MPNKRQQPRQEDDEEEEEEGRSDEESRASACVQVCLASWLVGCFACVVTVFTSKRDRHSRGYGSLG